MVRNITNKEMPKLAKRLNQRMVELYRQGKTNDPDYKALQNALSQNPFAKQDKNGMWKFPQGMTEINRALSADDRNLTKAVREMKTMLSDYEWGLYKDDKQRENAMRRAANEAMKHEVTREWGIQVKRSLSLALSKEDKTARSSAFKMLWEKWRTSTGQDTAAHITGKDIVTMENRFKMHMKSFPGWAGMTRAEQKTAISVMVQAAIRGDYRGRRYKYEDELATILIETKDKYKARKLVDNGATPAEANTMQLFREALVDWNALDKTSKKKYHNNFKEYYDANFTKYLRL